MLQRVFQVLSISWVWVGGLAVAAFLVLFWVLRGAPVGQEAQETTAGEAPRSGYRDRVVAASVFAVLLVAVGAYVAMNASIVASLVPFVCGFGMLLYLVRVNRRYRHASPILRRVVQFSNMALGTSLVAGVLIVGNVLAFKYGGQPLDFSGEGAFSLSPLTIEQLKKLDRPVKFTVLIGVREAREPVVQLLEMYRRQNPLKITLETTIEPFRDLEKFDELRKRAPEVAVAVQQGGGVVVEYGQGEGADRLVVNATDLFEGASNPSAPFDRSRFASRFKGEDALTSALARLKEGKKPTIVFISGHGEPPTDQMDPNRLGLGLFRAKLTGMGANIMEINLVYRDIPADAALAIVVARAGFQPMEITRLKSYMEQGGPVLALVGSGVGAGLNDLLRNYKVELGSSPVVEPRMSLPGRRFILIEYLGSVRHPVVNSLARLPVYIPNAVPLQLLPMATATASSGVSTEPEVETQPIVQTTREAWAESDPSSNPPRRDPKEPRGPFTLGVAVMQVAQASGPAASPGAPKPRLVVFSSAELADNFWVSRDPTNLDLLMNAVNWLRGRSENLGIAPKTHVAMTLIVTDQQRAGLVMIPTFAALFFIIGLGVIAYISRRI